MNTNPNNGQPQPDGSGVDAILDTAKTIYNEEIDRFKQTETKTSIALGFDSALIFASLTYFSTISNQGVDTSYLIYSYFMKAAILAVLTFSAFYFIRSIRGETFQQIDLNTIVDDSFALENSTKIKMDIAYTYNNVVEMNTSKLEIKLQKYGVALTSMSFGFLLFIIYFIIEEIIKNVR